MGKKRDEWDCHSPTVLVQKTLNGGQGMECIYTLNPWQLAGLRDAVRWREVGPYSANSKRVLLGRLLPAALLSFCARSQTLKPRALKLRISEPVSS